MKNSNNGQTIVDQEVVEQLLEIVSYRFYEFVSGMYDGLLEKLEPDQINEIIVKSIAINLGHVIGQMDVDSQQRYAVLVEKMIKEHTLLGAIEKDRYVHGAIGHA